MFSDAPCLRVARMPAFKVPLLVPLCLLSPWPDYTIFVARKRGWPRCMAKLKINQLLSAHLATRITWPGKGPQRQKKGLKGNRTSTARDAPCPKKCLGCPCLEIVSDARVHEQHKIGRTPVSSRIPLIGEYTPRAGRHSSGMLPFIDVHRHWGTSVDKYPPSPGMLPFIHVHRLCYL